MGIESKNNEKLDISDTEAKKIFFPTVFGIFKGIEIHTPEKMGEREAKNKIGTDIIKIGKETAGPNRNGENITDTDYVNSHIPNGQYFTCEQFIDIFNQKNQERIKNNNKIISSFDFYGHIQNKQEIKKKNGKLFTDKGDITDIFQLVNKQTIYEEIKDKSQFISYQEFESQITTEIIQLWITSILDNTSEYIIPQENNFEGIKLEYDEIYQVNGISEKSTQKNCTEFSNIKFRNCRLSTNLGTVVFENAPTQKDGKITNITHKETFYSQKKLPGKGLKIPGRHIAKDRTIRDIEGYICVAANYEYIPKGSKIMTTLGPGKVYDTGGMKGNRIDIYTDR